VIELSKYACSEIFDEKEVEILCKIIKEPKSLYKLYIDTNIPIATLWRIVNKLRENGYLVHEKRGVYKVTYKGALLIYLVGCNKFKELSLKYISELYNLCINKVKNILDYIIEVSNKYSICVLEFDDIIKIIPFVLFDALNGLYIPLDTIEFVLKALNGHPSVISDEDCHIIPEITNEGEKILLGKCKNSGFVSNHKCPHVRKILDKKFSKEFLILL
jgi:predicted transcriptional regulator